MQREGYSVDMPASVDALRNASSSGQRQRFGGLANVHARIPVDDHVRASAGCSEIEAQWGPAPGQAAERRQLDPRAGRALRQRLRRHPARFGYEGDPMRLLFEKGFAPTHAFSAFYRWMREDFGAHAVLHFGTHGALEFMPGKQNGMTAQLLARPHDRRPAELLPLRLATTRAKAPSPSAAPPPR
jgi:magnesium chelatase subunit H